MLEDIATKYRLSSIDWLVFKCTNRTSEGDLYQRPASHNRRRTFPDCYCWQSILEFRFTAWQRYPNFILLFWPIRHRITLPSWLSHWEVGLWYYWWLYWQSNVLKCQWYQGSKPLIVQVVEHHQLSCKHI